MPKKQFITCRVNSDVIRQLDFIAERDKLPRSAVIRRALEHYIKHDTDTPSNSGGDNLVR